MEPNSHGYVTGGVYVKQRTSSATLAEPPPYRRSRSALDLDPVGGPARDLCRGHCVVVPAVSGDAYLDRQAEAAYELYRVAVTRESQQAAWRQFVALSHQAEVARLYRLEREARAS